MPHAHAPQRRILAALIVSCLAVGAAPTPSLAQADSHTQNVRIAGTLTRAFADSFGTGRAHGHSEELTFLTSFGESISISDESGTFAVVPSGDPVIVEVAVPSGTVPAPRTTVDDFLDEAGVELLSEHLDVPATALAVIDDEPSLPKTVVGEGNVPSARASTMSSTGVDAGMHPTVIVLPIPSDYNGDLGDCPVGDMSCLPPEPASWEDTNGPLSEARARELLADAATYWNSQTFGRVVGFPVVEVVREWVAATSSELCSSADDTDATFTDWWREYQYSSVRNTPSGHMMVFTGACDESVDGVASIGTGVNSGGLILLRNDNPHTLIHEIGHNFSLGHSNVAPHPSLGGFSGEYLGLYSPMGLTVSHDGDAFDAPALDVAYQDYLGVLPTGQLTTLTNSGTQQITATSSLGGTRAVLFKDPVTDTHLYAEYRSGSGIDQGSFYASGFTLGGINLRYGSGVRLYALKSVGVAADLTTLTHSHSDSTLAKMVLSSTETYTNAANGTGITVRVPSLSPTQASVEFTYVTPSSDPTPQSSVQPTPTPTSQPVLPTSTPTTPPATQPVSPTTVKKTATARLVVNKGAYGTARKATLTLSGTPKPTGKGTVYVDGKKRGTTTLKSGKATFTLPKNLKAGKHTIKITVPASSRYRAVTQSTTFTVPKLASKVTGFTSGTKKVRIGKKYSTRFTVNTAATLQRSTGKKWTTVKKLKKGSHKLTVSAKKSTTTTRYRVVIKGTSQVTKVTSKTLTIRPVKN